VLLVVRRVCEGVDVGRQAGRRGSIYAGDMVVDANLLRRGLDRLLYEVDEVWRAQFAQGLEGLGASLDGGVKLILVDSMGRLAYYIEVHSSLRTILFHVRGNTCIQDREDMEDREDRVYWSSGRAYSGTAGAVTMAQLGPRAAVVPSQRGAAAAE
jgi:hypothetical protein